MTLSLAGAYHTVVKGNGDIIKVAGYDQRMNHTFRRNTDSVGISCACMGGRRLAQHFPPTQNQVENMCREAAQLALSLGWTTADITDLPNVSRVLTHAEAASNLDFGDTILSTGTGISNSADARASRITS